MDRTMGSTSASSTLDQESFLAGKGSLWCEAEGSSESPTGAPAGNAEPVSVHRWKLSRHLVTVLIPDYTSLSTMGTPASKTGGGLGPGPCFSDMSKVTERV